MNKFAQIVLLVFLVGMPHVLYSQPYIYFVHERESTKTENSVDTLFRLNLKTKLTTILYIHDELLQIPMWDQTQSYLYLDSWIDAAFLMNCSNIRDIFTVLDPYPSSCNGILYCPTKKCVYALVSFRGIDGTSLYKFRVDRKTIKETVKLSEILSYGRNCEKVFFSSDKRLIYFPIITEVDGYIASDQEKVMLYSTKKDKIIGSKKLSEIGHPGAEGYELNNGKDGVGIVTSYLGWPNLESYFTIYNFDKSIKIGEVHTLGGQEPFLIGQSEYLALAYDDVKESEVLGYSGKIDIYDVRTGKYILRYNFPPRGEIYQFDNYQDTLYYVLNKGTKPEIFTIDVNSIKK